MRLRALALLLLVPLLSVFADEPADLAASKMLDEEMNSEFTIEPKIAAAIVALAGDERRSLELRERALHVLEVHRDPAHAKTALQLAAKHDNAELAHYAALSLLASYADDPELRAKALRSPVRAVREEASIATKKTAIAGAIALDDDEAPVTRGRAIQCLVDSPSAEGHAVLVQLLEPEHWFWGVPSGAFRIHSLVLVLDGLDAQEDRDALELLRVRLAPHANDALEQVLWRLDEKLRKR